MHNREDNESLTFTFSEVKATIWTAIEVKVQDLEVSILILYNPKT